MKIAVIVTIEIEKIALQIVELGVFVDSFVSKYRKQIDVSFVRRIFCDFFLIYFNNAKIAVYGYSQ